MNHYGRQTSVCPAQTKVYATKHKHKRNSLVVLILALMVILSACNLKTFSSDEKAVTPTPTSTPLPTAAVVLQTTISADGEVVLPIPPQKFSFFGVNASVYKVYVIAGQQVKMGQPLAEIDDTDLQNAIKKAKAQLESLQAQIANEEAAALPSDLSEARSNLEVARAKLKDISSRPSKETITQAAADLRLREIDLRQAQEAYDAVAYRADIGLTPQAAKLQEATLTYEKAQAVYNEAIKPATESEIATAKLTVKEAENRLQKLLIGARPEAKAVNQAKLHETQLGLEEAEANLIKAKLLAPWDGVVTEVNVAPGVSAANGSVTIAQVEPLRFATANFSERNLADVKVGAEATIFLKSYPTVPFPALVQRIDLQSAKKDGDTALFTIYLDFNSADFQVRPGMTGRVEIAIKK